jgi:site-specific DNA recombinase
MKVILYPRVSSKKQAEEGDSIDAQIMRLKTFCKENGHDIIDIYTDAGKSASISSDKLDIKISKDKFIVGINLNKRPAFKKILQEVNSGKFEGIVFYKWDRFSRDNMFSRIAKEFFLRNNIMLIPSDDTEDPLATQIMNTVSEVEIEKMKQRVRNTRLKKFEDGIMVGRAPFGYRMNKRKKVMEIDKKKSVVVQDIFKMTAEGVGYKKICEKHKLKPQSYYNIIRNPVYIGIIQFEGKQKKGKHEPIVSEEVFSKIHG